MIAREYFADVRRASSMVEQCQRIINELKHGAIPAPAHSNSPHGMGDHSDPTATAFFRSVYMMDSAIKQRDVCTVLLGEALQIIDALHSVAGDKADVLELYYIDLMLWSEVAQHYGVSPSTVRMWRDELFGIIDSNPTSYLMAAKYEECLVDITNPTL